MINAARYQPKYRQLITAGVYYPYYIILHSSDIILCYFVRFTDITPISTQLISWVSTLNCTHVMEGGGGRYTRYSLHYKS